MTSSKAQADDMAGADDGDVPAAFPSAGPGAGSGSGEVALEGLDAVRQEGRASIGSLRIRGRGTVAEIRIGFTSCASGTLGAAER